MKVVINKCYGGFGLSRKATLALFDAAPEFFTEDDCPDRWISGFGQWVPIEGRSEFAHSNYSSVFKKGEKAYHLERSYDPLFRAAPALVAVVEQFGEEASDSLAELEVVEIPDGVSFDIDEYDGIESIHETHRSWA